MAIRIISMAQFFKPNNRGNYEIDDSEYFANFLNTTLIDKIEIDTSSLNEDFVEDLNIDEIQSLYYLTGRTIHQIIKNNHLTCKVCLEAIQTSPKDPSITQYKQLTELIIYFFLSVFVEMCSN
jgi:hypothetical protein